MKTNQLSGSVITALHVLFYIALIYRYINIRVIIIYWRGQYARYKSVPDFLADNNPSVMKSYSNSLTYVLNAVEIR